MAHFIIECPNCGKYAEGNKFFFTQRKINCACGYTINVSADKLTSTTCSNCGNAIVYDQTKGDKALCPVCRKPVNTLSDHVQMVEFSCRQCGARLRTSKAADTFVCPLCDCENDVTERVMSEQLTKDGVISVIKYEGDNETLVWKHPAEDFNMGSQLIVHESQEAVFFRDGQALDLFGSGRYTLETQKLPIMEKLYKLPANPEGVFHSEVYFVNLTTQMGIKWGTDSKVRLFDPSTGLHVELGASGEFNIRVCDSRKLILKMVGTADGLSQKELMGSGGSRGAFRALVMTQVKSYLAQTIKENEIHILEIDEQLVTLSKELQKRLNIVLEEYGLTMPEFYVTQVVTPDDDPNFKRVKQQYADQYLKVREEKIKQNEAVAAAERKAVEARTAAQMKIIDAEGEAEALKIQKAAEADAYRMQAAAEAEEMRLKGYSYQQETSRQVSMEAMKNGITGSGGGAVGGIGELAGLGMGIGVMGSVIGMTKEAMNPVSDTVVNAGNTVMDQNVMNSWNCTKCGMKNITSKFCPDCGSKRREDEKAWECPNCGAKGNTSLFCPGCGFKRPEDMLWDCPDCGKKGISSKFCPDCGQKRGE